jgi:hypothetical protein
MVRSNPRKVLLSNIRNNMKTTILVLLAVLMVGCTNNNSPTPNKSSEPLNHVTGNPYQGMTYDRNGGHYTSNQKPYMRFNK